MSTLPKLALSVRQPWAWAIIHAGKDIENRSWQAVNHGLRQRGRIVIHASKGMSRDEYIDARHFMIATFGIFCPPPCGLHRGCIIGSVEVVDVVSKSDSQWFFGPRGLVLRNPEPCEPIPSVGALGYFLWSPGDPARTVPPPAVWMANWGLEEPPPKKARGEPEAMPLFEQLTLANRPEPSGR